jgi:predicted PurR-regulated permease PerM
MNFVVALYAAILFFILSPNVLLRLPKKGSVNVVAAVHAVVFGLVLFFSCIFVSQLSMMMSNMTPTIKEGITQCLENDNSPCEGGEICVENKCTKI